MYSILLSAYFIRATYVVIFLQFYEVTTILFQHVVHAQVTDAQAKKSIAEAAGGFAEAQGNQNGIKIGAVLHYEEVME